MSAHANPPWRMNSTAWYAGKKRMVISPSPVPAAQPAVTSAYAPAPMMGISATWSCDRGHAHVRWAILHANAHCGHSLTGHAASDLVVGAVGGTAHHQVAGGVQHAHANGVVVAASHVG